MSIVDATMASVSEPTAAAIQSVNQFMTGLIGGYLIDRLMDYIPISEENVTGQSARQILQVIFNGIAITFMLKALHGTNPGAAYRDPTGGYLLMVGLFQSQPSFMRNGKHLIEGLTQALEDIWHIANPGAAAADTTSKTD